MKLIVFVLLLSVFTTASAFHFHHFQGPPGPPGVDGVDGTDGTDGVNFNVVDDDLMNSIMAASMAASTIEFSHGTRKTQIGFGVGFYGSQNAFAVGAAKLFETDSTEFMGALKASWVHDNDWAVGAGATFLLGGD